MSLDRFIDFSTKRPTLDDLVQVAEDFVEGVGSIERESGTRFYVKLPGLCVHPLRRVLPADRSHVWKGFAEDPRERFIEVYLTEDGSTLDVITREADDFTNAIASRYAEIVSRWWEGKTIAG